MKKTIAVIAFLFILFLSYSNTPSLAAKFVVSPPRFEFTLSAGSSTTEAIQVANSGEDPLELRMYLMDWEMKKSGDMSYVKPGSTKKSCSSWVRVNPQVISLAPRESQIIRFTITAPQGTAGSYWTMLFIEPKQPILPKSRMGVAVSGRVGVIIYATIPGTEVRTGKIVDMKVEKDKENKYKLALTFENTGMIHYRPKGSWEIKDAAGKRVNKKEIEEFLVLPQFQRTQEIPLGPAEGPEALAPPGKYTLSVVLDFGAPDLVGGDLIFEVPGTAPQPATQGK